MGDDGGMGNYVLQLGRVKNGLLILRYAQDDRGVLGPAYRSKAMFTTP